MEEPKILLFIPGYNCEKQIVRVLSQLDEKVMKYISQVIMVNNLHILCTSAETDSDSHKKQYPL